MSTVAPPPEKTNTDRKTTAIECTSDDNNDMDDMVHYNDDPLEYLIDDRSEMWNTDDPFHILLLDTTFKQKKVIFISKAMFWLGYVYFVITVQQLSYAFFCHSVILLEYYSSNDR